LYKPLSSWNRAIYLLKRIKGEDGKEVKEYEHLNLYLVPEVNPIYKNQNDEILEIAKRIQSERIIEISNGNHGLKTKSKIKSKANLLQYIESIADEWLERSNNKQGYYFTLLALNRHLEAFRGNNIKMDDIDSNFVKEFIKYLRTAKSLNQYKEGVEAPIISQNYKHKLIAKFRYILRKAGEDGILLTDPFIHVRKEDIPKAESGKREYLTIDELKKLKSTECRNDTLKRAFMFCSFTGLRYSDIKQIVWENIVTDNFGKRTLQFKQKKTKQLMDLKISNEAFGWLPEKNDASDTDIIFRLPKNCHANTQLSKWVEKAGVKKKISYHCSRHTAATMGLTLGIPIEVQSKLLGHSKISTTQIYAKIIGEKEREAVDKQDGVLND